MSSTELGKHDRTLVAVITQYQTLAMISLGKIQNPATGKVERDLDQASVFIDILEMLKVKCRTDTPEDILRMLDTAVMDLQLNYLDERKKDQAAAERGEKQKEQQEEKREDQQEAKQEQQQEQEQGQEQKDTAEGEAAS